MNKKLWTLLVAVLLIVTMSVCLFACADDNTTATRKGSSLQANTNGKTTQSLTKTIQVNENASFEVATSEVMAESAVKNAISLKDAKGNDVAFRAVQIDTLGKKFRITPTSALTSDAWYDLVTSDKRVAFTDYGTATKLSIYVLKGNAKALCSDNVTYLTAGSSYISNFQEKGALKTFDFDALAANQTLSMGQIVLVENLETNDYTAYQILGVEPTATAGIYRIAYTAPNYDEVYKTLEVKEKAVLGDNNSTVTFNEDEIKDTISSQLALAGFNIGVARFDINPTLDKENKVVKIAVDVTIPDIISDKDGVNSLDLTISFLIETKITVDTDISIGALIDAAKNGVALDATFDNKLTFGVTISDEVAAADQSALDAVIEKIANMLKNADEDDISIDVFNWIIPIGGGIADVNFDVNLDMNFRFAGKVGITSTSTAVVRSHIFFNPSTEEHDFKVNFDPKKDFSFDSVEVEVAANAAAYIGLDAAIKFDLLGGVISVGVGAEVGNFNRVYGTIASTNLLEDPDAYYGVYFEGGIYYDAKFLYNVAKLTSGSISFFGGRQEKVLYSAGSQEVAVNIADTKVELGFVAKDLVVNCKFKNIVTGAIDSEFKAVDASKVKIKNDPNGYVTIADGKISLTEAGIQNSFTNYIVTITVDGIDGKIIVNKSEIIDAEVGDIVIYNVGNANLEAAYLNGTEVEIVVDGNDVILKATRKGAIIVNLVQGETKTIYAIYNVE